MSNRMAWLVCFLVLAVGSLATWSWTHGQPGEGSAPTVPDPSARAAAPVPPPLTLPTATAPAEPAIPPTSPAALPAVPATGTPAAPAPLLPAAAPRAATTDSDDAPSPLREQIEFSGRRGADWLFRMNTVKGRFVPGLVPALNTVMDNDNYLRQAGAAFALARAARATREEAYAARATQALLTLLDETVTDSATPPARHTPLPSAAVNRLAAAALLVLAIHELPAPQADLLEKSDQLCQFLRTRQKADGSFAVSDADEPPAGDPAVPQAAPGQALYALMRSQQHRPASWKVEAVRKALDFHAAQWKTQKSLDAVPWQTAAYAEAFLYTKEPAYAEFVGQMNDWLCELQYDRLDPRHPEWLGGFMDWADGKPQAAVPRASSAGLAESLAGACRVARASADLARFRRYTECLERSLQFLTSLQYTDANTQHYSPWFRQRLLGGFHASHQDGDLPIDATQHAVSAMMLYLTEVKPATATPS